MRTIVSRRAFVFAMLVSVSAAWGQGDAAAVLEYASGDDIVVIRDGRKVPIKDPIGFQLLQGDQIQTGRGVFVELRLNKSGAAGSAILKLAENTTFVLERLGDGQTSLQLVYGRVRAKVDRLAGTDTFSVRSTQAIAGVRGTDFGLDVVASRAATAATTTNAYCFEGSVVVTAFVRSDAQAAEELEAIPRAYMLGAGEMLKVEGAAGKAEAVKSTVDDAIQAFWTANEYVSEHPAPKPQAVVSQPPAFDERAAFDKGYAQGFEEARAAYDKGPDYVPEGFLSKAEAEDIRRASLLQKGGLLAGGLVSAGALALAVNGFMAISSGDVSGGSSTLQTAVIVSSLSLPFLVLSLFAKP